MDALVIRLETVSGAVYQINQRFINDRLVSRITRLPGRIASALPPIHDRTLVRFSPLIIGASFHATYKDEDGEMAGLISTRIVSVDVWSPSASDERSRLKGDLAPSPYALDASR